MNTFITGKFIPEAVTVFASAARLRSRLDFGNFGNRGLHPCGNILKFRVLDLHVKGKQTVPASRPKVGFIVHPHHVLGKVTEGRINQTVNGIIKELETQTIKSPTGKDKWNKRSLEVMLSNEKYKGVVRLFDDKKSEVQYLVSDNHPAIITEEIFEAVQKEKANRSNIVVDENGQSVRKSTKYSSKNKN